MRAIRNGHHSSARVTSAIDLALAPPFAKVANSPLGLLGYTIGVSDDRCNILGTMLEMSVARWRS